MLSTSGNALNSTGTNSSTNGKSNLISASGNLLNSTEFMLPTINNLATNNPMATSSNAYLNEYNKLYRDALFQPPAKLQAQQPQQSQATNNANIIGNSLGGNLINSLGNSTLNNIVVNNITNNLNNLSNHTNGLPNHLNQTVNSTNNKQPPPPDQQSQLINNPDFVIYMNRCNQYLELHMYVQALNECNQALNLVSDSTLARFRKSQALLGLKRYYECEKELWHCINLEPNVLEYRKELMKVKQLALMSLNLNIDHNILLMASQKYDSIKEAVDALMWPNSMIEFNEFNYSSNQAFQSNVNTSNNLTNDSLMNGWNSTPCQQANNRFGSINQLINNGTNLLFNNGLITNNLLLNHQAAVAANNLVVNRNNGTTASNVVVTNGVSNSLHKQPHTPNSTSTNNQSSINNSNLINTNSTPASSNINTMTQSIVTANNQSNISNSPLSDVVTGNNLTNGLTGHLSNGNRFNYLLRGLEPVHHPLLSQQQSTNGQNSNQNIISNNQQQIYNRMLPSFIDNSTMVNPTSNASSSIEQTKAVLNCARSLSSKLTLNDNLSSSAMLNGTNGLMSNAIPSPICSKLTTSTTPTTNQNNSNSNGNLSSNGSNSLTNSCNYNIFSQMPEIKLIETIVPNLIGPRSNTSSLNNATTTDPLPTTSSISANPSATVLNNSKNDSSISNKLLASLTGNSLIEMNKAKESIANNLQAQSSQEATKFDECNKSANKSSSNLLIDNLIAASAIKLDSGVDLRSSNNSAQDELSSLLSNSLVNTPRETVAPIKCEILNFDQSTALLSANNSPAISSITNNSTASISSTPPATNQCTSYSDIVKRAKKISQQSSISNGLGSNAGSGLGISKESSISSTSTIKAVENESSVDDSIASKRPTNLWGYNGLRVANVSLAASKSSLMSLFSKFGRIRLLERIINKTTTNNIWVYFDNSVSPVDAVTKLQNAYIEGICVDADSPLRLFFAPTDDQKDLKFSRPKQPPDNKGECYYWRTTNCFSKEQCPLLHLQANKNIDAQVWMRVNPENSEAVKEGEEDENTTNQNAATTDNAIESSTES